MVILQFNVCVKGRGKSDGRETQRQKKKEKQQTSRKICIINKSTDGRLKVGERGMSLA